MDNASLEAADSVESWRSMTNNASLEAADSVESWRSMTLLLDLVADGSYWSTDQTAVRSCCPNLSTCLQQQYSTCRFFMWFKKMILLRILIFRLCAAEVISTSLLWFVSHCCVNPAFIPSNPENSSILHYITYNHVSSKPFSYKNLLLP